MVEEDKEELGDAIKEFNRGVDTHIEGKLEISLKHFQAALPTFQEFGVEEMIAGTYHEMGMILQDMGDYNTALDYYQKSLQLSEKKGYRAGCAKTLFQMSTLYEDKGDILSANEHSQKSKAYATKKPGMLNFIIIAFLFGGLYAMGMGLLGISGNAANYSPPFLQPELWEVLARVFTSFGSLFLVIGIMEVIAGIGLYRLKGFGWVMGVLSSLMTAIIIIGVIFYWYLSKDNIQEMYKVK
ncbi:MAG TPA: tetratricopeptide repeat protein [Candidatus Deferrimicrobium sp.]|nr:tetratricopeptide repeat protein [Candidatus Deferrimicrobium sp.]